MPKKMNPFYEKMLKAKEAKKALTKKVKQKKDEEFRMAPKLRGDKLAGVPEKKISKRIEVTSDVFVRNAEKKNDTTPMLERALDRIREQSQNL